MKKKTLGVVAASGVATAVVVGAILSTASTPGTVDYINTTPTGVVVTAQGRDIVSPTTNQTVLFGSKLVAAQSKNVSTLVFACRTPTGSNCDFGHRWNQTIGTSTYTLTGSRSFSTAGTYRVWVAFNQNGTWFDLTPEISFSVSSPTPTPSPSPSVSPSNPSATPSPSDSPSPTPSPTASASPSSSPPPPGPQGAGPGWTQTFSDEFDGTAVDTQKWTYRSPAEALWCDNPFGTGNPGNQQLEFNQPQNASISDGTLKLLAKPDSIDACGRHYSWSSALLTTNEAPQQFSFRYGWIEASVKMPPIKGFWPAFWTWSAPGSSEPGNGETDVFEYYSDNHFAIYQTSHVGSGGSCGRSVPFDAAAGFHTYGANIQSTGTDFYIDGVLRCHAAGRPSGNNTLLLDNFVYSQIPPAAGTSAVAEFDWVRAWSN